MNTAQSNLEFPRGFIWGAAAASYQVEGAATEDGKGLSVWDMFCRQPGKIWSDGSGAVACDHYHRFEEDVRIMQAMGIQAYRLSICWPRVIPGGVGAVNDKGLEFYDRLVDALLGADITPWVTLFHWDYPYDLYLRGGWLNRDSADWFADYARVIAERLSDRVSRWMTLNEPQCFLGMGHSSGGHAPGLKLGFADILRAAHHSLLAHGKAVQVIRANAKTPPCIGAAPMGIVKIPAGNRPEDIEAARALMFAVNQKNCGNNAWFSDPMVLGHYPADGLECFRADMPEIQADDMRVIHQPLDFYGVNVYNGQIVRAGSDDTAIPCCNAVPCDAVIGPALTTMTWKVRPESLYWGPRFFYERYKLPVVITENGMANCDWVHLDGKVHDPQRIDFVARYLGECRRAVQDGVDVRGYFYWSILDNFEWAHGYRQRFGLVHVDYNTQKRTPKDSAWWYRDVIAANGGNIPVSPADPGALRI